MDFNNLHNHYKDVDFKKGFKKPLPYLIILFILIVFSILYYLDSQLYFISLISYQTAQRALYLNNLLHTSFKKDVTLFI